MVAKCRDGVSARQTQLTGWFPLQMRRAARGPTVFTCRCSKQSLSQIPKPRIKINTATLLIRLSFERARGSVGISIRELVYHCCMCNNRCDRPRAHLRMSSRSASPHGLGARVCARTAKFIELPGPRERLRRGWARQ